MQRGCYLLYNHLTQTQVVSHWLILVKTLVHQLVNLRQLVRPDDGVGDVLLVPGGHVGGGPYEIKLLLQLMALKVSNDRATVLCYGMVMGSVYYC